MLLNFYYENRSKFVYVVFLAFLLAFQSFTSAQTGTIKGRVLDKTTKDPLVGANILVQGTNLGAAADIDGNFIIHNVAAGSQVLAASYIGYKNQTVNISITANQTSEIDINLEAVALEGKTVIVTAQAKGQLQAINQQLSSNNIVNIVSSEKMQELPDANIAQSIGRLPGISLQRNAGEAEKVVVRGLSPQFNQVTIEGIPMSATSFSSISSASGAGAQGGTISFSQDRSIDLSLLSDNMVQGVEVSKTLRPDMDANALGGTINLTLRTAQPGLHFSLVGNGAYNNLRDSYNNYKFAVAASDRFFDDKVGALVLANIEEKQLPSDQFNATYAAPTYNSTTNQFYVNTNSAQLTDNNTKRRRYGVSVILDYTSELVDIKFFNVYSAKADSSIIRDFTSNFASNNFEDDFFIYKTTTEQRTHSLQATFKLSGTELPVSISYTKGNQNTPNAQEFTFLQSGLSAISSSALVYGQPADLIHLQGVLDPTNVNTTLTNMLINSTSLTDAEYDAKIDWRVPFKVSDTFSGRLSAGAKYHSVERESDNSQIYDYLLFGAGAGNRADLVKSISYLKSIPGYNTSLQSGLPAYPWVDPGYGRTSILGYPLGASFDVYKLVNMQNYYYYTLNANTNRYWESGPNNYNQDYNDKENTKAGYIMGEFNIGNDLTIVAGARWQQEQTDISAYHIQIVTSNQNGLSGVPPVLVESKRIFPHWYPSVNVKYKATENIQVVGAIYNSVSLPSYSDISPLVALQQNTTIVSGNPLLKPSTAWNFDLGASVFNNDIGLFTANFFYKRISNLIYNMQNYYPFSTYPIIGAPADIYDRLPGKSYYDTTWANANRGATLAATVPMNDPDDAYLRGIELSWQTHLWYLPGVLSGIVLDLNASWMSSNQMYPSFKVVGPVVGNKDTLVYTTTAGSLQNQPKAVYNAILGWDYKGFSSRFSFSYQQITLTSVDTRYGLEDFYYDNVTLLDISLKQQILENLSIFASATNINSHIDNYYFEHPAYTSSTTTYPAGRLPTSGQTYGWNAQFGISYNY